MKIYKLKVIKRGRKWLEVENENENIDGKILIDHNTNDLDVGSVFNIEGSKRRESSKYGTKVTYECNEVLSNERAAELKEKIEIDRECQEAETLIQQAQDRVKGYNYTIKSTSGVFRSFSEKIDYAITIIKKYDLKNLYENISDAILTLLKNDVTERLCSELDIYSEYMNDVAGKRLRELYSDFDKERELQADKEKAKYLETINSSLRRMLQDIETIQSKNIFTELIEYEDWFNEENVKLFYKLKSRENNYNKEKSLLVFKNLFEIRNKKSLKTYLENKSFNKLDIDELEEIYKKYGYKNELHILNLRINDSNVFKDIMSLGYLQFDAKLSELFDKNVYVAKNPWILFNYLVLTSLLEVKDDLNDLEKIQLYANNITGAIEYRKESIYGFDYYFVKESKEFNGKGYKAYYIISLDAEHGTGFQHRLPWKEESSYDKLSVKDILDFTFGFYLGFKRIQGDVIAREVNIERSIVKVEVETNTLKIATADERFSLILDSVSKRYKNGIFEKDEERWSSKPSLSNELRKNMNIEAAEIYNISLFYKFAKNGSIFCNGKSILEFGEQGVVIGSKEFEGSTKLKYGFYYADVVSTSMEDRVSIKNEKELVQMSCDVGKERCSSSTYNLISSMKKDSDNRVTTLGDHIIQASNMVSTDYGYVLEGPVVVSHSQHKKVVLGEKGKFYQVGSAIRHKSKEY